MFCENCGKKLPDDAKNCDNCGNKVVSAAVPDKPQPQTQPQPQQQPQQQPQPQPQQPQPQQQYRTNNTQQNSVPPAVNYQNQQQSNYNPSQQPYNQNNSDITAPMTIGGYILTFFLLAIPIVGIIMIFVWAFGDNVNLNKKNLAKAYLILMIIGVVISILMFVLFYSAFSNFSGFSSY